MRDLNWVSLFRVTEKWALDLGCIHLQLSEGTSSECISADDAHSPAFFHVMVSELGARGCLARALQANEHDYIWFTAHILISLVVAREHLSKLVHNSACN